MDIEPQDAAYFQASWQTIVTIAQADYKMDHHTATIYAWCIFGRMTAKDYQKMEH
jgi:hypothetical protein